MKDLDILLVIGVGGTADKSLPQVFVWGHAQLENDTCAGWKCCPWGASAPLKPQREPS